MENKVVEKIIIANTETSQTIILMKGLPGSGKSTYAKAMIAENTDKRKIYRINKDDIRSMYALDGFSKQSEQIVLEAERTAGMAVLNAGHDLIVDSTNLHPKHLEFWREKAIEMELNMITILMDTPVAECIRRDALRANPVGKDVIKRMCKQLNGATKKVDERVTNPSTAHDGSLPSAVICDLDGTLCLINGRSPFSDEVLSDVPNKPVVDLINMYYKKGVNIIFLSGRMGSKKCEENTRKWIDTYTEVDHYKLHMRADKDSRRDSIVKEELYYAHVHGVYNVNVVLDDRNQVVDLWRKKLNLPCFQVYYGDF